MNSKFGIEQAAQAVTPGSGFFGMLTNIGNVIVSVLIGALIGCYMGYCIYSLYAKSIFRGVADQKEAQVVRKTKGVFLAAALVSIFIVFFLVITIIHFWRAL